MYTKDDVVTVKILCTYSMLVDLSVRQKFKQELDSYGRVEIADNAKVTVGDSIAVVSILIPSAAIVQDTILNKHTGVVASKMGENGILSERSTIDSRSTRSICLEVADASSEVYIDSPVSVTFDAMQSWGNVLT